MRIYYYLRNKYYDIKCWFRHNFNKHHWNVVKSAYKGYPFDFGYLWELEKAKLQEMLHYFNHADIIEDYKPIQKDIKLALKLLDIIREEELTFTYRNGKEFEYKCLVNVNLNNGYRYFNEKELEFVKNKMPHMLYMAKAKRLYYKLLEYKIETWWD